MVRCFLITAAATAAAMAAAMAATTAAAAAAWVRSSADQSLASAADGCMRLRLAAQHAATLTCTPLARHAPNRTAYPAPHAPQVATQASMPTCDRKCAWRDAQGIACKEHGLNTWSHFVGVLFDAMVPDVTCSLRSRRPQVQHLTAAHRVWDQPSASLRVSLFVSFGVRLAAIFLCTHIHI